MRTNNINKKIKKIFPILFLIIIIPILTNAQTKIIPDCGALNVCGYGELLQLVNNIIKWIIMISVPIAAGVFAWAGFSMMIGADNPGKRKDSIDMMKKVFIGFVFILAAWIIVTTITNTLLSPEFKGSVPVEGDNKK